MIFVNEDEIMHILKEIEKSEEIEIIYACEAGSRVWGFADDRSDHDIRFIYKNLNISDYLSIRDTRDVIEITGDDIDIVGWDIRKALQLHYKSNPNLREWLVSNIIYMDNGVEDIFKGLGGFNRQILKNHYSKMARNHWRRYSGLEFGAEKIKKYLYVIRYILTWKLLNQNVCPPISIHDLMAHEKTELSKDIEDAIAKMIDFSRISEHEIFMLNNYILDSLNSMKKESVSSKKDIGVYDERFRELLMVI